MPNLEICKCCGGKVSSEARTCPHCGQPDPSEEWGQVRSMIREGKKIQAIKLVRERTGWDLAKAIQFVDSL